MNAGRGLALVMPLVLGASLAVAEQAPPAEKKATPPRQEQKAPAGKGLVVFIDPVTGQIRQPDAAEIGSLAPPPATPEDTAPRVEKPLETLYGPGGAVGVVLDERFQNFMVVTKAPDGKLAMDCVEGRKKAEEAVATQAAKAAPAKPAKSSKPAPARANIDIKDSSVVR